MPRHLLLEWMEPAFEGRFFEQAREASGLKELEEAVKRQEELTTRLRQQLIPEQVELLLKWEECINYRTTIEKEWLYYAGIKDGLHIWKHLLDQP